MTQPTTTDPKGLEGVVAASSAVSDLDGAAGRLIYRGYDVITMADQVTFEEVAYLLSEGQLPDASQLKKFSAALAQEWALPVEVVEALKKFPPHTHPMDVLRTGVSLLGVYDPDARNHSNEANRRKSLRLLAQMASLTTAWERLRKKQPLIPADPALSHTANILYTLKGQKPDALSVKALDLYLVLLADHSLNASTFTARVVVSTLSDLHSAITAALGSLKGALHGGANEKAMEMFKEIGDPAKVDAYIDKAIAEKKKIMGFGHRVYKVEDPRSNWLKDMSKKLGEQRKNLLWYDISVKVAEAVKQRKNLHTNVDFYSASVLYYLGIETDLFTPVFAISRVSGWTAHVLEQLADNRLIRPDALYIGPPLRAFVPLSKR